jgi:autotransporter translocation and assembly factor TamB
MKEEDRPTPMAKKRHPFRFAAKSFGLLSVFVVSVVAAALLHLNVRSVRSLVTKQVNSVLAALPADQVKLGGVDWLSVRGLKLSWVDANIAGIGQGHVSGLTVHVDVLGTAWRAVADIVGGKNRTRVEVKSVTIDGVDFLLALGKRPPSPPSDDKGSKELQLLLDRFELGHAYIHGTLDGGRVIDADIDHLWAKGAMDGNHAEGAVKGKVIARALVPEPVELGLDGNASMGLLEGSTDRRGNVKIDGSAGQAAVAIVASIDRDTVEANVELAETQSEAVRALFPTAPVYAPVSAHVHASGTLPSIDFKVETHAGKGTLTSDGNVKLDDGPAVQAHIAARDVDIAAFSKGGSASKLGLDADCQLRMMPAKGNNLPVAGTVSLRTLPGSVGDKAIPVATANVTIAPARAHANVNIAEPGLPIKIEADRDASGEIRAAVDAAAASLADVPLLRDMGLGAKGRVSLTALATISSSGETLDARAQIDATGLDVAEVNARSIHIDAVAKGPLKDPVGSVTGRVTGVSRDKLAVNDLSLSARGSADKFALAVRAKGGTLDSLAVNGIVARGSTTRFSGVSARIVRAKQAVDLRLTDISYDPTAMAVDGLRIDGLGSPIAISARRTKSETTARVQAPAVDLVRVATLAGIDPRTMSGKLAMDVSVDIAARKAAAKGQIHGTAVRYGSSPKIDAVLDLDLNNREMKADLRLQNPQIGAAELNVDGTLGALPQQSGAFEGAEGHFKFSTDHIAVGRLCQVVSCPGDVGRAAVSAGAVVGAQIEVVRKKGEAGGDTQISASVDVDDQRGRLAHLDTKTRLELAQALRTHGMIRQLPLDTNFSVQPRAFDDLPVSYRPANLSGTLKLQGNLKGTLEQPALNMEVGVEKLQYKRNGRADGPPLDVSWVTKYEQGKGTSNVDVRSGSDELVQLVAEVNAAVADFLDGGDKEPRWNAAVHANITRFPLDFLPAMAQQGMRGSLSGKLAVEGIHEKPVVAADLNIDDLRTARQDVGAVTVSARVDEHKCEASLDARTGGTATAVLRANAGCKWTNATVPGLDTSVPVQLALDTTAFPLEALGPAVQSSVERLSGKLNMHLRFSGHPDPKAADLALDGTAELQGVNMLPLAVGREVRGLDMKMSLGMDGVKIENLSGEMGGGRFSASGAVELKDRVLTGGRFEFHVPRLHSLPVTYEGVSYGNVWGDVLTNARVENQKLLIDVKLPTLRFELSPQRTASLEKVEDNPAISVLQPLGPKDIEKPETALAMGGGPPAVSFLPPGIVVNLQLGENVGISRDDLKVELQTPPPPENPKFTIDSGPHLDGAIRILGGRVPVAGKVFQIERGTVRFGGADIANPSLDIDATYQGEFSTISRLDVHVAGTPKDIKLTLTSQPAKSQNELLAILAFGDSDPGGGLGGAGGAPSGSASSADGDSGGGGGGAAGAVGGAVLSQGLNQLLSQSIIPVRASVSSSSGSAAVDVTERIRVEYIRNFAQTVNGQPTDANKVAFDWRFKPRWMLRTQVGDLGTTSLDLLWQRWY